MGCKLSGGDWLRYSVSIWSDIRRTGDERRLPHPAVYPAALVQRLLQCYCWADRAVVLDPFLGSGTTLVAAAQAGFGGVGFDVVPDNARLAYSRLQALQLPLAASTPAPQPHLITSPLHLTLPSDAAPLYVVQDDARRLRQYLDEDSIDIAITSPPYWCILGRKAGVLHRPPSPYSALDDDLGNIDDYQRFLDELGAAFAGVRAVLKPGAYCIVVVMDLRQGPRFIPYHMDIAARLDGVGLTLQDILIWDRRAEYNNLVPLGYGRRFIINKVHEYVMVFQKK